jgi:hypothetical protein
MVLLLVHFFSYKWVKCKLLNGHSPLRTKLPTNHFLVAYPSMHSDWKDWITSVTGKCWLDLPRN